MSTATSKKMTYLAEALAKAHIEGGTSILSEITKVSPEELAAGEACKKLFATLVPKYTGRAEYILKALKAIEILGDLESLEALEALERPER